jgi:hypothetical protein
VGDALLGKRLGADELAFELLGKAPVPDAVAGDAVVIDEI